MRRSHDPVTFDTLRANHNLKAAGFEEAQTNAIIDTLGEAFSDTGATKTDIAEVKADISRLEAVTKQDISVLRADMKASISKKPCKCWFENSKTTFPGT